MVVRIMTVCTGNICRSPMAQVVLADRLAAAGLSAEVDSTGVSDEEWANPIDSRAKLVLEEAGYSVPRHRARRIARGDLAARDLILAMTHQHLRHIQRMARQWGEPSDHLHMLREFDPPPRGRPADNAPSPYPTAASRPSPRLDIDDPWYGGMSDFASALAQIEAAAPGVVAWVRARTGDR
jgi:protein-tyrosine phosphatase